MYQDFNDQELIPVVYSDVIADRDECAGNGVSSLDSETARSGITWVPSVQPVLPFQAGSCGALGIQLYQFPALGNPVYPLITIELGRGDDGGKFCSCVYLVCWFAF